MKTIYKRVSINNSVTELTTTSKTGNSAVNVPEVKSKLDLLNLTDILDISDVDSIDASLEENTKDSAGF